MADTRALLAGLEAYRDSLRRLVSGLRLDFDDVARGWAGLDECFAGNAADEFRPIWEGASQRFRDYVDHTTAILAVLDRRIESLREADRATGLGS